MCLCALYNDERKFNHLYSRNSLNISRMADQTYNRLIRIKDFYEKKSILLTGSTGFLGVVLLEALLRLCPGIEHIYILMREKKGVKPENRKDLILNKLIFKKLKESQPDVFKKICVIPGDVALPDLGMDEMDLLKVTENVNIVFHVAACISFLKSLRYMLMHNSGGTQNVIEVCRKLKKLDAFVYTSTAFANCNRFIEIEEEIYSLPYRANKFLNELNNGNDDSLQKLVNYCQPSWPNSYTFSKSLAENIIKDNASDLPTAIIRPSLIISVWKEPLPGYVEDNSGISALSIGTGKGFIKVLHADPEAKLDLIPADVVAHTHMLAAMRIARCRSSTPLVINCTSFDVLSLKEYTDIMLEGVKKHHLPNTFRTVTTLKIEKNVYLYWFIAAFEHHIPAFVFDAFLKLNGSKFRLVTTYRFVEEAIEACKFFMLNSWTYQKDNFQKLFMTMHPEDKQILGTSCKGDGFKPMAKDVAISAPFYQLETDKKTASERIKLAKQRYWLTICIQFVFVIAVFCIMYLIFSTLF